MHSRDTNRYGNVLQPKKNHISITLISYKKKLINIPKVKVQDMWLCEVLQLKDS